LRPDNLFWERAEFHEEMKGYTLVKGRRVEKLKSKPAEFFRQVLGFEPTDYQKEFIALFEQNQFLAARWCRQMHA
jgi:hypothetical protein